LIAPSCFAQEAKTATGNFEVSTANDATTLTISSNDAIGLRCVENRLSVVVERPGEKWSEGDTVHLKFHTDDKLAAARGSVAMNSHIIEIPDDASGEAPR
jgi:hypothetical protein